MKTIHTDKKPLQLFQKTIVITVLFLSSFSLYAQNWVEMCKLIAPDRDTSTSLGMSVSISGNYAVAGAYREKKDVNGANSQIDAGAVYIFKRDAVLDKWNFQQKIVASDRATSDQFGESVCISGDYIAVGAWYEAEDANGKNTLTNSGSVYVSLGSKEI